MPRLPRPPHLPHWSKRRRPTIRRQLLTIVLVPSISLIAIAMVATAYLAVDARRNSSLQRTVAEASTPAAAAILGLQEERRLSLARLAGGYDGGLEEARAQVLTALNQVSKVVGPLVTGSDSTSVQRQLGSLTGRAEQLQDLRAAIDANQVDIPTVYLTYSHILAGFGASLRTVTQEAPDARSTHDQLTSVDLFYGAESLWGSASLTEVALLGQDLPAPLAEDFRVRSGAYHAQLAALAEVLGDQEQAELEAIMNSSSYALIDTVESALGQRLAGGKVKQWPPVGLDEWRAAVDQVGQELAALYARHAQAAADRSNATVHRQEVRAWVVGAVLLATGLVVVLVAVRLSGQVARRLRRLRDDTRRLSSTGLPEAMERLRHGQEPGPALSALDLGEDEIGEVAAAFNEAQGMAMRAATDEARSRAGTREVFLNIARRTQGIAYQQLKVLDQAQEHVEDPTHLRLLFQLDSLATRARRHAENLVILGGKQPGRRWSQPVPLIDVVRGATGETANYEQVLVRRIPEVSIAADKAADVIHILAELIDNATSFGPPGATVEVRGEIVGRGLVLEVEDRGLGIPAEQREEFNRQLRDVPDFADLALSADTRLGLFVVGRLATRHEIRVTLRDSGAYGGTVAVVLIPIAVLVQPPILSGQISAPDPLEALSVPAVRPPGP